MAKKLKVYRTSIGFFDLAIAAPSMKAAAEAWGAGSDIFKRGFAKQTEDPKVVKAAMAAPGVVLRRPVGSHGNSSKRLSFQKHPRGARRLRRVVRNAGMTESNPRRNPQRRRHGTRPRHSRRKRSRLPVIAQK